MDNQQLEYEKSIDDTALGAVPTPDASVTGGTDATSGSETSGTSPTGGSAVGPSMPTESDNGDDSSDSDRTPSDTDSGEDSEKKPSEDGEGDGGESGEGDGAGEDADKKSEEGKDLESKESIFSKFDLRFLSAPAGGTASESEIAERRLRLAEILLRLALGIIRSETLPDNIIPLMDAALAHEAAVKARREGEIAGRNAVIEEQMLPLPAGAPDLNAVPASVSRRKAASIFDLADMAR